MTLYFVLTIFVAGCPAVPDRRSFRTRRGSIPRRNPRLVEHPEWTQFRTSVPEWDFGSSSHSYPAQGTLDGTCCRFVQYFSILLC